jgi:hypothetical protein
LTSNEKLLALREAMVANTAFYDAVWSPGVNNFDQAKQSNRNGWIPQIITLPVTIILQ